MGISKVTRKGQITIPKDVRDSLGITSEDYVVVVVDGEKAILSRARGGRVSDLKGRLATKKPFPGSDEVRRTVGEDLGRRQFEQVVNIS
jgi:AbrB family looped-hinge helix DNA binding protein